MKKTVFYYGTISGIVMVILFIISFFAYGVEPAGSSDLNTIGYASIILSLSAVTLGIRKYRDKYLNGKITFGEAFGIGSEISGIAALILGTYSYFHFRVIAGELKDQIMNFYRNKIINSGESQEIINQQLKHLNDLSWYYGNPILLAITALFTVFLIGLLISAISAVVLKRKSDVTQLESNSL